MSVYYKDLVLTPMSGGYWAIEKGGQILEAWISKEEVRDFCNNYW